LAGNREHVADVIRSGTLKAREITERTKRDVMAGLGVFQL
jgi:tryptophanyl-tRNA synthetase